MITPEGYFEGDNSVADWHCVDGEFTEFAIAQLQESEVLLFGRKTFELMQSYWPTATAFGNDPVVAGLMAEKLKIVISKTRHASDWSNTRFVNGNVLEEILRLKSNSQKDILLLGSAVLANSFMELGLIDEFRLMVNPVLLGGGKPLFKGHLCKTELELLQARTFASGNVLLYYKPRNEPKYLYL